MVFQDKIVNITPPNWFIIDVIGHVVEKTAMKDTEKNGKVNKVMDATLEDLE
jgi:hypothetical protein